MLTVLDCFSGAAGGWSLGLERTGFKTVAACELDPWRRAVYGSNFPGVKLYDDVRELTAKRLRRDLGYLPGFIAGSPPCQDASSANWYGRGTEGARTGLFFEAVRLVGEVRPIGFAFENVAGLGDRGVDWVLGALEDLGYAVWPLEMGAWHVGAPHKRNRLWVIGFDADRDGQSVCAEHEEVGGVVGLHSWREPWSGVVSGVHRVADGLSAGVARRCVSAYGDAVMPRLAEVIGRGFFELVRGELGGFRPSG